MTRPEQPPETYQQWLQWMSHLTEHPGDLQALATVTAGRYCGTPAETFLVRLSETVGQMLTFHCRRFLRQLDQALADGEPDMAQLLAVRLKKNLRSCLFYRSLPFLEQSYVQELDAGFSLQLEHFWKNFLTQLHRSARESADPAAEELVMEMSRIKIV